MLTADELFEREHENCGASWECEGCGRPQCTRCHPSPREEEICADCDWTEDPNGEAA